MINTFLIWGTRVIYFLLALVLLFSINSSFDLDSEFYLLGGSCFYSALAVNGQFDLTLRGLLVVTSLLIVMVSFQLLKTKSWRYLVIGSAIATAFLVINQLWTQKHLFQGYTWSGIMDWYDAVARKCYIFDGPQYGVLLAISLVCVWGGLVLRSKKT